MNKSLNALVGKKGAWAGHDDFLGLPGKADRYHRPEFREATVPFWRNLSENMLMN